jgi:hypothetical protein
MKLPYYDHHFLREVAVFQACPGCGKLDKLSMRSKVISYAHDGMEYYVGCNCGWMGPVADNPLIAAVKWECRAIIKELSEGRL